MTAQTKVRAKFFVKSLNYFHNGNNDADQMAEVTLGPVVWGNDENTEWSKYTPSGEITMTITNPSAIEAFNPGDEYYVDFTPAKSE